MRWTLIGCLFISFVSHASIMMCNGSDLACHRRYNDLTYATSYQAESNVEDGFIAAHQKVGLKKQLQDGIRALVLELHEYKQQIYMCSRDCALGNKSLFEGLRDVLSFLDENPNEVVTLFLQGDVEEEEVANIFAHAHATPRVFLKDKAPWPTLREMISANQRIIVFKRNKLSNIQFLLSYEDNIAETDLHTLSPDEFSCRVNQENASLVAVNHIVKASVPVLKLYRTINQYDYVFSRVTHCEQLLENKVNFVVVNHYQEGEVIRAVSILNRLHS